MLFSIAVIALSCSSALAAPAPEKALPASAVNLKAQAAAIISGVKADGCDLLGCAESYISTIGDCATVVETDGLDFVADAECIWDIYNDFDAPSSSCNGCF